MEQWAKLFIEFLHFFCFVTFVDEFEKGVVLRAGRFHRRVGPGWRLHLPFGIDRVITENVAFKTTSLRAQTLTTRDGDSVVASVIVAYAVKDVQKFLLEVDSANGTLGDIVHGTLSEMARKSTFLDMLDNDWHNVFVREVRRMGEQFGIYVYSARLADLGKIRTYRLINFQDIEEDDEE